MAFDFKFSGLKELSKNVGGYKRSTSRHLQDGMMECASAIVEQAQGNLYDQDAIDTGELFESVVISNRGARVRGARWKKPYYNQAAKTGFLPTASEVSLSPGIAHRDAGMHAVVSKPIGALASVTAGHGPFVEFGTIKMAARPFFGPAVDRIRPRMERLIATEAKRIKRIEDVRRDIGTGNAPSLSSITGYTGR